MNPLRFFYHLVVRDALRHPILTSINILSVALGVAVYLAIQITNYSANRALAASVDVVAGRANLEAEGEIDDTIFPELQKVPGCVAATPMLEKIVTLPDYKGEYLHLLGVDPFTDSEFRTFEVKKLGSPKIDSDRWFSDPSAVAVTKAFAQSHHLETGGTFRVRLGEKVKSLSVAFLLAAPEGDSHLAAMDIGWLQELSGDAGKLTSVLFRVSDPLDPAPVIARLKPLLPATASVQSPQSRSSQIEKMVAGFQLNLSALSMASLVVGVFLIYNTVSASVVRRRPEIGILRSLGVSGSGVRLLFLGEAGFYSICGVILGIALGWVLATRCVGIVSETISNLYILTSIEQSYVPWDQTVVVSVLGLLTGCVGAWVPAAQAANLPPLGALNLGLLIESSQQFRPWTLILSIGSTVLAVLSGWLALLWHIRILSFASAALVLLAACLLSPTVTQGLGRLIVIIFSRQHLVRLAAQNLIRSLYRNSVTSAALGCAVALLVSVSIMIFSFRLTLDRWMGRRLIADIFVTTTENQIAGFDSYISPSLIAFLQSFPEVQTMASYRELPVTIRGEDVTLGVTMESPRNCPEFVGGGDAEKERAWHQPDSVIASEPLARRLGLKAGNRILMSTPLGEREFMVAGIFYDYTSDQGLLMIQRQNFDRFWGDSRVQAVSLYLRPGSSVEAVLERARTSYPGAEAYAFQSNRELRGVVERIFDQTFQVTNLLRGIALAVSIIGIILNLTIIVKERERELAVLRSLGGSSLQLLFLILLEAFFLTVVAVVLGIIGGCALAIVLTDVINVTFFGWTIPVHFPWADIAPIGALLIGVGILAGLFPALLAARASNLKVLRGMA
ncbi:MAG: FtsX-like permease family protein [Verrucomicrobia bacterium]|nr:FtsX-like permease family protein [Verrucomicrobiota bacterium]